MSSHEKLLADPNQPYESNTIQLRGILIFGVGLLLLILLTFFLMWFLLYRVLETDAVAEDKLSERPMMMGSKEQLPPEPRLQAAPGFGIDGEKSRVNLELLPPQSEYNELKKVWEKRLNDGQTDPSTGTIVSLPIEDAKKKLLTSSPKSRNGAEVQKSFEDASALFTSSSAGRVASDKRR